MPQMVDDKGDIYEVDAQGNPIAHIGNVNSRGGTMGTPKPKEPKQPYRWQANDGSLMEMGEDGVPRVVFRDTRKPTTSAKPLRQGDGDKLEADVAQYAALRGSLDTFNPDFGGNLFGGVENTLQAITPDFLGTPGTPGQRDWWANFKNTDNVIRNGLYGASLTAGEKAAYDATTVTPSMKPEEIRRNLTRRTEIIRQALGRKVNRFRAAGYNPEEIDAITGDFGAEIASKTPTPFLQRQELPGAIVGPDGVQRSNRVFANPNGGQGGIATGATAQGEAPPPQFQQAMSAWVEANRGKMTPESYVNAFNMMAQTFNYPGRANEVNAVKEVEQLNKGAPYGGVAPGVKQTSEADQLKASFFSSGPGAALASFANANMLGIPGAFSGGAMDAIRQESPRGSFLGDLAGSVTGVGGIAKGAMKAGLTKELPQALMGANLAYGTARGASEMPENPLLGAGIGLGLAGAGEGAGRLLVAPAVKAIAQSRGGQEVGNAARRMAPGIFGRRQMPVTSPLSTRDQMIVSAVGDNGPQAMGNLREASRLGLPFTLADANPNLRALAGSAVRKSPVVRQLAEDTLRPRATGQIDRLQSAISRDFGDPTNILTRSDELMTKARTDSKPFYEQFENAPGASSVQVDDILNTPLGQEALQRARTQAMNDKMDPTALGFDLNDQGEVILTRVPSFKTLDYVKRSFDDIANEGQTPFGTFQPNQAQATAANLASELRGRVDAINPAYGQARAAYAGPAGEREALNMGTKTPNMSADKVRYTLGNLGGNKPDQYRLGALSALSEKANNVNYSRNPYDAVAGSPEARARLGVLWPQTAPRFTRQADLEAEMGRTFTEALGGSQTQARNMADQAFDASPVMTLGIDAANAVATGSPPVATMARLGGNFFKDSYRLGLGQAKANEIGPVLLNPDAAQAAAIFADIRKNAMKAKMLGSKTSKQAKTVGDITASAIAAPLTSYLLGQ